MFNKKYLLSEYFNKDGIIMTLKYLINYKSLKPDLRLNHIRDINLLELKNKNNVKFIVFDKDNTIAYHKSNEIPNNEIKDILNNFKENFGKENIAILSNTAGSKNDINYEDLKKIEENFQIKVIKHENKKPNVDKEILDHFKIKYDSNSDSDYNYRKNICYIGDRLFTDIILGKHMNGFTILVDPLNPYTDNFIIKVIRVLENKILNKLV